MTSSDNFFSGSSRSGYKTQRLWHDNERIIQPHRLKVLDFLLQHHGKSAPGRFLTVPGVHWRFETQLLERQPAASIVGLERHQSTFEASLDYLPKMWRPSPFLQRAHLAGVEADQLLAINILASKFLNSHVPQGMTQKARQIHVRKLASFTGVHLSPGWTLGDELVTSMRGLSWRLRRDVSVPVAITFTMGRGEQQDVTRFLQTMTSLGAVARRLAFVEHHGLRLPLHRTQTVDIWRVPGSNALTWCALWHPRTIAAAADAFPSGD